MKGKIIAGVLFFAVFLGGVAFLRQMTSPQPTSDEDRVPTPTIVLPTISDTVSVQLDPKPGNQIMVLHISGLTADIIAVEYELTYITGNGLPRGVLGKISVNGEKEITRDDIVLGTCSSGKCVYDTGVSSVHLSLKFSTSSGPRVFRKSYDFS